MQRFGAISPRRGMLKGTARSSTLFECPLLVLFYGSKFGDVIYFCFVGFFFFLHKAFPFYQLEINSIWIEWLLIPVVSGTENESPCDIFSLYHSILYAFHHEPYYYANCKMNNLIYFFFPCRAGFFQPFDHSHHLLLKPILSL